jgi:tetratricopeptide (TPR) repeat protein
MPTYLWSGKDRHGAPQALRIEAATVEQSRTELEQRGFTELVLQRDDFQAALRSGLPELNVSAEEELRYRKKGKFKVSEVVFKSFTKIPVSFYVVFAAAFSLSIFRGQAWLAVVSLVAFIGMYVQAFVLGMPGVLLAKLHTAKEWRRWDEVLNTIPKLERFSRYAKFNWSEFLHESYRCQAIAGLGNLAGALKRFERFEADPKVPHWVYLTQVGTIHGAARSFDNEIECLRQAIAEGPNCGVLYLSLAELLAMRKRDIPGARAALATAESHEIPEGARPGLTLTKGTIEVEAGNYPGAKPLLEEGLRGFEKRAHHGMVLPLINAAKTYLCLAYAKCGNHAEAARYLAEIKDYLVAIKEDEFLARCEQAIRN